MYLSNVHLNRREASYCIHADIHELNSELQCYKFSYCIECLVNRVEDFNIRGTNFKYSESCLSPLKLSLMIIISCPEWQCHLLGSQAHDLAAIF